MQDLIKTWCNEFVTLFKEYSVSNLSLPKLHHLRYHFVESIKIYGVPNNYTTETYETLHKFYVKNPYRMSNKKDFIGQITSIVCLINYIG